MKIYVKGEMSEHRYVKSFFQRHIHYVVLTRLYDGSRRILNIEDLKKESQDRIRKPFLDKSLKDYM